MNAPILVFLVTPYGSQLQHWGGFIIGAATMAASVPRARSAAYLLYGYESCPSGDSP